MRVSKIKKNNRSMLKYILKYLIIISFILSFLIILNDNVLAIVDSAISSVEDPKGSSPDAVVDTSNVNTILKIIRIASVGTALVLIIVDGIKYLLAVDSVDKADIKKKMILYFIGAFLIFGATTVYELIANFANEAGSQLG